MKNEIKHIIYLMLENRSFDQLLGWLYDGTQPKVNIPEQNPPTYNGLKENTYYNLDKNGKKHYVIKGVDNMNVPIHDPHEEYSHVNIQLFETKINQPYNTKPTMGGFYKDFATYNDHMHQIMQSYTPDELPVLNGLAKNFAVSDYYFCSLPTQTNSNRAFAAAGNSLGINDDGQLEAFVSNRDFSYVPPHLSQPVGKQFNQKTMWNVLSENGLDQPSDWMHYYSQGTWYDDLLGLEGYAYTRDLMTKLQDKSLDKHFDKIDTFFERAEAGTLPKVCFLEPEWGLELPILDKDHGINGCDYHPPTNLTLGEVFVKKIYDSLTSNKKAWGNTLFIINFDEHGGTYDHVAPTPCAKQPWESDGTPKPQAEECQFDFKRFGVRVPLVLVSPRIQKSTVFRATEEIPYDHTSVIATILKILGIPKESWGLGAGTANAPTFENVFEGNPIHQDIPKVEVNKSPKTITDIGAKTPPNDIHLRMAHSLLNRMIEKEGLNKEETDKLNLPKLIESKTVIELSKTLKTAVLKIKERI